MIISQKVNGDSTNLFQLHTLSDGDYTNGEIKASIFGVTPASTTSEYGTFGVSIRKINDTDSSPEVLENFNGCTLDPSSTDYVARKIGNRYGEFDDVTGKLSYIGDYESKSDYVRVEMDATVDVGGVAKTLVPFGFAAIKVPFSSSIDPPAVQYVMDSVVDEVEDQKIHRGIDLSGTYEDDNLQFLKAFSGGVGANEPFHLEDTRVVSASSYASASLSSPA